MRLPTAKDISPYFDTDHEADDERCAREDFLGKNLDEAEALFCQNALFYGGSLLWMGAPAFRYYVLAFIRYIRSVHSRDDPDAINCFAGLLEQRSEHAADVAPIAGELTDACHYILKHYDKFDADPIIYGDLRIVYEALMFKLHKIHARSPDVRRATKP